MDLIDAIRGRRSTKRFVARRPGRDEVEQLLELATLGPNHRMTQPWRFYVMGERAQRGYGELRAELKSQKVEDPKAAAMVREKVMRETAAVPMIVAVAMVQSDDPQTREEDYAATFMGIQNLLLAAQNMGLQGHIHTGRIMDRPVLREALGVPEGERVVALIDLGEPAEVPSPKVRARAGELTRWTD
jgi:nitroreductase